MAARRNYRNGSPNRVDSFAARICAGRVESVRKALRGQADALYAVTDGFNEDLPPQGAGGVEAVLDWALGELDTVGKVLTDISERGTNPERPRP